MNLAVRAFQEERYEEAESQFQEAVEEARTYEPTAYDYVRKAQIQLQEGEGKAALDTLDTALEQEPENANVHLLRGHVHRRMGNNTEAFESLDKALELDPEQSGAVEELWELLSSQYAFGVAIRTFQKHLEKAEDNVHLTFYLGQAYLASGDYERATEVFTNAVESDPHQSIFHSKLVQALESRSGKEGAAIDVYERLVEQHPVPMVKLFLARLYVRNSLKEKAVPLLEELVQADVSEVDISLRVALADAFGDAEMYAEAAEQTRRVWGLLDPDSDERIGVGFDLGKWLVKAGEVKAGIRYLRQSLNQHLQTYKKPPSAAYYFQLGNAYWLLNDKEQAELWFRQFDDRIEGSDPETLERLGDIYLSDGNPIRAARYFKRLVDFYDNLPPGTATIDRAPEHRGRLKLAQAYFGEGSLELCIPHVKRVIDQPEFQAEATLLLARAYLGFESPQTGNAAEVLHKIENTEAWSDEACALLGQALLGSNPEQALKYIKLAYQAKPEDEDRTLLYAEVLVSLDQYDEARTLYQKVLQARPRSARALKGMGNLERRTAEDLPSIQRVSHLEEAVRYCENALSVARSDTEVLRLLGDVKRELARAEAEVEALKARLATVVWTCVVLAVVGAFAWLLWWIWRLQRAGRLFRQITRLEAQLREVVRREARSCWGQQWEQKFSVHPFKARFDYGRARRLAEHRNLIDVLDASYFGELIGIIDVGWDEAALGLKKRCKGGPDTTKELILRDLAYIKSWRDVVAHRRAGEDGGTEGDSQTLDRAKMQKHMNRQITDSLANFHRFFNLQA